MNARLQQSCLVASIALMLSACGPGDPASMPEATLAGGTMSRSSAAVASTGATGACPALTLTGTDAQTLTGA